MIRAGLLLALLAGPAAAVTLDMPANAELGAEVEAPLAGHGLATGPWSEADGVPLRQAEGRVTRQAWRVAAGGLSPLQMVAPLRAQLEGSGFEILLDCAGPDCGGFDFRFAIEVMPPPAMFVDLVDYHYLSALRAEDGTAVSLVAARTAQAGYLQVTAVIPPEAEALDTAPRNPRLGAAPPAPDAGEEDLAARLERTGSAVLADLIFETGSARLGEGDYASLAALAAYLAANPSRTVALVGHTDSTGALEANIALSRRRAASVRERLVTAHDVPRDRMQAEGMGYLSPVASNLTEAGREANRRVEVILVSTD